MPTRARSITVALALLASPAARLTAQAPAPPPSEAARAYLAAALDTLQAIVLRRDTISWRVVRDSAFGFAAGARTPSDTYAALAWALRRVNKHSFLQARRPGATSELVDGRFGYVHVPQWSGASPSLADSLQTAIRTLDSAGACGWIVDLRGNGGGNMWPMLAGIGPLVGDSIVGAFGTGPDADRWLYRDGMSGILHAGGKLDTASRATVPAVRVRDPRAPVAVLFDGATASSGEVIALAFRGRPNSRSFGEPTSGFATSNRGARLPDGANMVVTTAYQVDRSGVEAGERIRPDEVVPGPPPGWPFATDAPARAAAAWLARAPGCRR
jgi:carboxyl-terminal processing protease